MRLSMLSIVQRTHDALVRVVCDIEHVEAGRYVVSIGGQGNDEALQAVAKPVILRELSGRKAALERDLASYGVTLA